MFSWAKRPLCCTWNNTSGKIEAQLCKITEQSTWLQKVSPPTRAVFDLFDLSYFESWGLWLQRTLQTLGATLLIVIVIVSLVPGFSKKL